MQRSLLCGMRIGNKTSMGVLRLRTKEMRIRRHGRVTRRGGGPVVVSDIRLCLELVLDNTGACEVEGADESEDCLGFEWDGAHLAQASCEESLHWHRCLMLFFFGCVMGL